MQPQQQAEPGLHSAKKLQRISRAMRAYMEKAKSRQEFMRREVEEFELGKRHLANMMGLEADAMTQDDIDKAIEYLLPSGLFSPRARPIMKHPELIWPIHKSAQFDMDGRPLSTFFYTLTPNFYQIIHDIGRKTFKLQELQTSTAQNLNLTGTQWLELDDLQKLTLERLTEEKYSQFVTAMEHLIKLPNASLEKEFVEKFRKSIGEGKDSEEFELSGVEKDVEGRGFARAAGTRKTSSAEVRLWANGTGRISIDGLPLSHFPNIEFRENILFPFILLDRLGEFDVEASTEGGGEMGRAGAVRFAMCQALCNFISESEKAKFRLAGLLSRDPRLKERQKPGQPRARKKWIWKKR